MGSDPLLRALRPTGNGEGKRRDRYRAEQKVESVSSSEGRRCQGARRPGLVGVGTGSQRLLVLGQRFE